jgi:hypothetical protein
MLMPGGSLPGIFYRRAAEIKGGSYTHEFVKESQEYSVCQSNSAG